MAGGASPLLPAGGTTLPPLFISYSKFIAANKLWLQKGFKSLLSIKVEISARRKRAVEMGQPGAPVTTANPPWGCVVPGLLNTMGFVSFFSSHHFSFYFCLSPPPPSSLLFHQAPQPWSAVGWGLSERPPPQLPLPGATLSHTVLVTYQ